MWVNFLIIGGGITAFLCYGIFGTGTIPELSTTFETEKESTTATNTGTDFAKMSLTKECCTKPAIQSNYNPIGKEYSLNDLKIYEVGDISSKRLLIAAYDIFGFHPNTKQFVDILSKYGFVIAMPDFFRGSPWKESNFPPKDRQELLDWIAKAGSWSTVEPDLKNVIKHYKDKGVTEFGIFGFCWGGKVSMQAGAGLDMIGAVGIHPSFVNEEDADAVKCPVLLLPSKSEPDMIPLQKRIQQRLGDDFAEHHRFDDMEHGFAAARGNFSNELNKERVQEVISLTSKFFNKHSKITV